jgi:hypothetical protein
MNRIEEKRENTTAILSAAIVSFFTIQFALWTLLSHAATFFHIPWKTIVEASVYLILPTLYASYKISGSFSKEYAAIIQNNKFFRHENNIKCIVFLFFLILCLYSTREYGIKLAVILFGMISMPLFFKGKAETKNEIFLKDASPNIDAAALIILVILATAFTLCAKVPDLDDSTFLQIAVQTLNNKDLPPLTYDASLGHILEKLRFAPYRISAYETMIALLSEKLSINLLFTYYLLVPGITAALSVLVAFIFSRWLLPTNRSAIVSTLLFLLIMFAWGDSPIAYGSRYLVRIFQGKSLIIALTTPLTILVGLMLVQRPSFCSFLVLAAANICAVGVSSTGLIITICISMVLCAASISTNIRNTARTIFFIFITVLYPLVLAIWLKLQGKTGISLSEVGSYLTIDASLGSNSHESISLAILLIGYLFFLINRRNTFCILLFASFLFILNPLASEAMSSFTSRNMSWRLAWAVPIPLLLGVSLASAFYWVPKISTQRNATKILVAVLAIFLFSSFLLQKKWVLNSRLDATFGFPSEKISPSYYDAREIAEAIQELNIDGEILSQADIAAWLPMHLPNTGLIMPGHTYPVQLQTVLDKNDFDTRMKLYDAVNSQNPNLEALAKEMKEMNVKIVILPSNAAEISTHESYSHKLSAVKMSSISGYSIFRIDYDAE